MNGIREVRLRGARSSKTMLRPFRIAGATLQFTLVMLILMILSAEIVVRSRWFNRHVVANDWGSTHNQFEVQLGRLETIVAIEGSIECIFVGNSMVWRGFNPEVFARVFNEESGREMSCFNFGVDGMPASGAGALTPILVQEYQPQYLIYGIDPRDLAVPQEAADAVVLLDTPWLRYQQGQFSVRGWLYEHLHFLRYRESVGNLMRLQKTYLFQRSVRNLGGEQYGFTGEDMVGEYVSSSPLLHLELGPVRYYLDLLSEYKILPENVRALKEIVAMDGAQIQVILVEMPVPDTYLEFFGNGEADYDRYVSEVERLAEEGGVPFWRTRPLQLIADDGWVDYSHLNNKGARQFSRWFASAMASSESEMFLR